MASDGRAGFIAIVGRPNVGKSTLLNRLLGRKLSITSRKPQTTRHRILGVVTGDTYQAIFVDTPGVRRRGDSALQKYMFRTASGAMQDVDLLLFIVEGTRWGADDETVLARVAQSGRPVICAVNKVDLVTDKTALLPVLAQLAQRHPFEAIVPVSARRGSGVEGLLHEVTSRLPAGPPLFPEDQITDRPEQFLAAELLREQLMRQLGDEVPYGCTVGVERFESSEGITRIDAIIWVEQRTHKAIVIGRNGERLKQMATQARKEMEILLGRKVYLQTWVKERAGWSRDEALLAELGYRDG